MSPGDVVAVFNEDLGEWTAAQVIALDPREKTVNVLDLDWSGPEPTSVADLLVAGPLRGVAEASSREWVLPKSHRVIGNAPLLRTRPSGSHQFGWSTGEALYEKRMKERDPFWDHTRLITGIGATRLHRLLADPEFVDEETRRLWLSPGPVTGPTVDCRRLVAAFPHLVSLKVWGVMGRLAHAGELNRLTGLRHIEIEETFGMTASDCLDPARMTRLEYIVMRSIPLDYATATRRAWSGQVPEGVYLSITGARKPEWVAQNASSPVRDWDGRAGIPARDHAKAQAAWKRSTSPILATLLDDLPDDARHEQLKAHGVTFAQAFNALSSTSGFIETQERDELLDGLAHLVAYAPTASGVDRQRAADVLLRAVNENRVW